MAAHLSSIFGTDKDRVNCPFYLKMGACRHGDRCSRQHVKPEYSQTLLFPNMYHSAPLGEEPGSLSREEEAERFDDFCEEVAEELARHGKLESLHVCENEAPHLCGNVLARFTDGMRWAHLDIAGTAWTQGKNKSATGRPVSLLSRFILNRCS